MIKMSISFITSVVELLIDVVFSLGKQMNPWQKSHFVKNINLRIKIWKKIKFKDQKIKRVKTQGINC